MVSEFVVIAHCKFTSNFTKENIVTMHLPLWKLPSVYCQVTSLSSWVLCKVQHHHYVPDTPASKARPSKSIWEPPHIISSIDPGDALEMRAGRMMPFLATLWSRSPWGSANYTNPTSIILCDFSSPESYFGDFNCLFQHISLIWHSLDFRFCPLSLLSFWSPPQVFYVNSVRPSHYFNQSRFSGDTSSLHLGFNWSVWFTGFSFKISSLFCPLK